MSLEQTLARVEEDLRAGRVALARQRLRSLVGTYPASLDLRSRLAAVYRLEGDDAQAGRWSYLDDVRDPREVAAFEKAYGADPFRLMKALAWRGTEADAATQVARERLAAVRARAEEEAGAEVSWLDPRRPPPPVTWRDRLGGAVAGLVFVTLFLLVMAGLGSLLGRGIDVVIGWF